MYEVENASSRNLGTVNVYLGDTRLVSKIVPLDSPSTGYEQQNTYYYHADHIGNSTLITDYMAREYERLNFTPHGEVWQEDSLDALDKVELLFTGKQMDAETGWYNFGKRYLDPKTGMWLSADPALGEYLPNAPLTDDDKKRNQNLPGNGGIYNPINFALYHFAGNNPIRYVDPDGDEDKKADFFSGYGKGAAFAVLTHTGDTERATEIQASVAPDEQAGFAVGSFVTGMTIGGADEGVHALPLKPYRSDRGHHIPAKSMFDGDPKFDPKAALAIPKEVLKKLGIDHNVITGAQNKLYTDFAKTNKKLTWDIVRGIEIAALKKAGVELDVATATVDKAIKSVQDSGVKEPTRIPWGDN